MRARSIPVVAAVFAAGIAAGAGAQPFPLKVVQIVVDSPRGSVADITARVIGVKFYESTGQQFDTDNRPGAAGNAAAEAVAKSPADGYTLLVGGVSNAINATLYPKLPFDFTRDFAPVALATAEPGLLVVHPSMPARSAKELVALAKTRPGQLGFVSTGAGTPSHLAGELFKALAGISLTHVAILDEPLAMAALVGGKADLSFAPVSAARQHVDEGRLRALAVTSASRLASLAAVPTVAESGVAGYEARNWVGFLAPAKTPPAVVARLNAEITGALTLPDVRNQFELQDFEILGGNPARFADLIRAETARWAKVIRLSGTKAD